MDTLTAYRDAIQFVRDQTIRYMNKGLIFSINNFQVHWNYIGRAYHFLRHITFSHI